MLTVGDKFPNFSLTAATTTDLSNSFKTISNTDYKSKWLCVFFWPKDFTFVCPTEISSFSELSDDFNKSNCQILGCSTDSEFVHLAWRNSHPDLKDLKFPMLSDIKRELSHTLGIIDRNAGVCQRATYLVDPEGTIRYVSVTDLSVGRNTAEVLRVLNALQTGELCPVNWTKGKDTLKAA